MSSREAILRSTQRYLKLFNLQHKLVNNGSTVIIKIPGLSYEHYDRAGYVDHFKTSRLLEVTRLLRFAYDDLLPVDEGCVPVMFANTQTIYPSFHQHCRMKEPLLIKYQLASVGASSIVSKASLLSEPSNEELAYSLRKVVTINSVTRKTAPMSQKILDIYNSRLVNPEKFPEIEVPLEPESTYSLDLTTCHSDMDLLFHTNSSSYIRYSQDCASSAIAAGFFKNFKDDLCFYPCKYGVVFHKGETWPGEKIRVKVWEKVDDLGFQCLIYKNDKVIFYGAYDYYEMESNLGKGETGDNLKTKL